MMAELPGPVPSSPELSTSSLTDPPRGPIIGTEEVGRRLAAPAGPRWYQDLASAWFRSLRRRGRSPGTGRTYRWMVRDFGLWLEHCRVEDPDHLVVEVVYSWQDTLIERRLSASSRSVGAAAIRGLLRWGAREKLGIPQGLWEHIDPVSVPEVEPRALEPDHLALLMRHYATTARTLEQLRDRALFLFLLTTASRISAALSVTRDQVTIRGPIVIRQKGGSEHTLLPSSVARRWLDEYLAARGRDDQPALWIRIGVRGRHPLSMRDANDIWAGVAEQLRLPRFTNHVLKHTGVTELGDRGYSDAEIAKHAGWKGTAMVARYRKLRAARRQQMVDDLDQLVPAVPVPPAPRRRPRMAVIRGKRPR